MAGVYLFDEFDAIGGERELGNDVGGNETRSQFVSAIHRERFVGKLDHSRHEQPATSGPGPFPPVRRGSELRPSGRQVPRTTRGKSAGDLSKRPISSEESVGCRQGTQQSEIDRACRDAIKSAILNDKNNVDFATPCKELWLMSCDDNDRMTILSGHSIVDERSFFQ